MGEDEIQIRFPSKIPEELEEVEGLSDAMKVHIANRIADGLTLMQSVEKGNIRDIDSKCAIVLEILEDRSRFDKYMTKEEIMDIAEVDDQFFPSFIRKLKKLVMSKTLELRKIKKHGHTCYKL